mmetsp:Transcript_8095/g.15150  ORF Transcript_8095/g.15150 Transcript_8095/m.15150 type:complete len:82 (-) Transcript_8095:66-311(-)
MGNWCKKEGFKLHTLGVADDREGKLRQMEEGDKDEKKGHAKRHCSVLIPLCNCKQHPSELADSSKAISEKHTQDCVDQYQN